MPDKPTNAKPQIIGGIEWVCYRTGILRYEWRADAIKARVGRNPGAQTHWAIVDGVKLPPRFRSQGNAMRAAIAQAKMPESDQ